MPQHTLGHDFKASTLADEKPASRKPDREEIPLPIMDLIRGFERRARIRHCESYGVLAVMLLLLAAAAWVFVQAKEITTSDTAVDAIDRIASLKSQKDADRRKQENARQQIADALEPAFSVIGSSDDHRGPPWDYLIQLLNDNYVLKPNTEVILELSEFFNQHKLDSASIYVIARANSPGMDEFFIYRSRKISAEQVGSIPSQPITDVSRFAKDYKELGHKLMIEGDAISSLESQMHQNEVRTIAGQQGNGISQNTSLPFLLQLNITRFGTLTLVGLAIGILVPLYRFSARLATFYRAWQTRYDIGHWSTSAPVS